MNCHQLAFAAVSASFRKGNIVSFQYNGKNRVIVVVNVFPNRIIGKDKDGFKAYRFDRMQNQPILTVVS